MNPSLTLHGVAATCIGPIALFTRVDSDGVHHLEEVHLDGGRRVELTLKEFNQAYDLLKNAYGTGFEERIITHFAI